MGRRIIKIIALIIVWFLVYFGFGLNCSYHTIGLLETTELVLANDIKENVEIATESEQIVEEIKDSTEEIEEVSAESKEEISKDSTEVSEDSTEVSEDSGIGSKIEAEEVEIVNNTADDKAEITAQPVEIEGSSEIIKEEIEDTPSDDVLNQQENDNSHLEIDPNARPVEEPAQEVVEYEAKYLSPFGNNPVVDKTPTYGFTGLHADIIDSQLYDCYCSYCFKWGHYSTHCLSRVNDGDICTYCNRPSSVNLYHTESQCCLGDGECGYCGENDHKTVKHIGEMQNGTNIGTWSIPSVGVSTELILFGGQKAVDKQNTASADIVGSSLRIADHNYQGFEAIKKCVPGTVAYLEGQYGKHEYVCTSIFQGHNVKGLHYLVDYNYIELSNSNPDGITLYTCNENSRNVTIVMFKLK